MNIQLQDGPATVAETRLRRLVNGKWVAEVRLVRFHTVDDGPGGTKATAPMDEWRVCCGGVTSGVIEYGSPMMNVAWCETEKGAHAALSDFFAVNGCGERPSTAVPPSFTTARTTSPGFIRWSMRCMSAFRPLSGKLCVCELEHGHAGKHQGHASNGVLTKWDEGQAVENAGTIPNAPFCTSTDAHEWATAFMRAFQHDRGFDQCTVRVSRDEAWTWFANAIEAGREAGRKSAGDPS